MKKSMVKLILIITIVLIFIDQSSKLILKYNYEKPIGNNLISITLIKNPGIAFGMNSGNTKNIVISLIIILIIINFIRTQNSRLDTKTAISIGLILAGGISNLIDRIICGGVIDFIKIENFAIFNIADCYIVFGWLTFLIYLIKFNKEIVGEKKCEKH